MWMVLIQLSDTEESFVVSPAVLHTCIISIHPLSCSFLNQEATDSAVHQGMVNYSSNFIAICARWSGKVHRTSPCCLLSRLRLCMQGCLQVVQDLLTWVEASDCHFCLAICRDHSFRKKSSAIVSCTHWEMRSGSLKKKEAWQGGTCDQCVVCLQSPGCWLCCTWHLWEERGADGCRMGPMCVREQMYELSRLRWLSCC